MKFLISTLVSNTQRAKKLDRKVNQAESLREFAEITPRINNFVIELRQQRIFRGRWSVESQNPEVPHAHSVKVVKVKPGTRAPIFCQDSEVVSGPKKFNPYPDTENPAEQIISGSSQFFAGDSSPKKHRSLISSPAELVVENRISENRRSLISQPTEFVFKSDTNKTELSHFSRCRSNSDSGQIKYVPFPRIKLTKKTSNAFDEY